MKNQADFDRLTIRIPPDLLTKIKGVSAKNERSVNAEIIRRLADSIVLDNCEMGINKDSVVKTAEQISILANKISSTLLNDDFQE